MKKLFSIVALCLCVLSGFAQKNIDMPKASNVDLKGFLAQIHQKYNDGSVMTDADAAMVARLESAIKRNTAVNGTVSFSAIPADNFIKKLERLSFAFQQTMQNKNQFDDFVTTFNLAWKADSVATKRIFTGNNNYRFLGVKESDWRGLIKK